jgi:hypothetical protein
VTAARPGHDQVVLTAPDGALLCNSLGCARAGRAADVVVTYGMLNDPVAGYCHPQALWRECWRQSYPLCGACWEQSLQVALKYRPRLVIIDSTGSAAAAWSCGGRA